MNEVISRIRNCGIVPVIKIDKAERAVELGRALLEGGLPVAEVTFRTQAAAESIRLLRGSHPELLVGAGTVLTLEQVAQAKEAGASFVVTPGFNPRIVDACLEAGLPIVPGVNSPSQVEQGLERGLRLLKFFPAEVSGGVAMLEALHGPYAEVEFVPTGGIGISNLAAYLNLPWVAAVGGSWMVKEALVNDGQFGTIARLCAEARSEVRRIRGPGKAAATGD